MSTDEMPDFDSMSPEEMMKWMESLAKRQGATEGMTTEADMEIAEVDPTSVDESILQQEYIPHGWTKEKWEAHLAKEEAQKAARAAQQPPAPPPVQPAASTPPPPEPAMEPVAAAPAGDDTPDFDSMSPEQLMEWMESLAKRQGATEGMTTAASMDIAEVDPTSVDESILQQEYIPHGWTKEKWEAHLAKEEAQKAARAAQQPPAPSSTDQGIPDESPGIAAPDFLMDMAADEEPVQPAESMDWLSGMAAGADDDEELAQPAESMDWLSSMAAGADDDDEELAQPAESMDWLSSMAAGADDDDEELAQPAESMDWLSSMAADDEQDSVMPDLSALDDLSAPLPDLDLPAADAGDPMDWLSSLAGESDDLPDFADLDLSGLDEAVADTPTPAGETSSPADFGDDPLNWMESLAKRQGADDEELATSADMNIPMPDNLSLDGPGYSPYSFEDTPDESLLDEMPYSDEAPTEPMSPSFDASQLEFDDPGDWLDQLATGQASGGRADSAAMFGMQDDEDAMLEDLDDEEDVIERLNRAENVSPEEIQSFFARQFEKAAEFEDLEKEHDPDAPAIQAEIPDWLMEQMNDPTAIEEAEEELEEIELDAAEEGLGTSAYPAFVDEVAETNDEADDIDMPDWLKENIDDAAAPDDLSDIFADGGKVIADEVVETPATPAPPSPADLAPASPVAQTDLPIDTSDPWVEAFVLENEQQTEMEAWYDYQVQLLEGNATGAPPPEPTVAAQAPVQAVATTPAPQPLSPVSLQVAQLPMETELEEGTPELMPDWLSASEPPATAMPADILESETEAVPADLPDWLQVPIDDSSGDEAIPDWLVQTDETAAADDEMPAWLAGADVEPEAIPDWLLDTIEDEHEAIPSEQEAPQPQPQSVPPPSAQPIQPRSPAPQMIDISKIDVPQQLQEARTKVSTGDMEGGLKAYELVVIANAELQTVEQELNKLVNDKQHKENAAVYRVLGDTLMRQGKLQDALETYRRALNKL